jgi:hypothetical protein
MWAGPTGARQVIRRPTHERWQHVEYWGDARTRAARKVPGGIGAGRYSVRELGERAVHRDHGNPGLGSTNGGGAWTR